MDSSRCELIVSFHRGTTEPKARSVVESAGAQVKRRMRSDHPTDVILLVESQEADAEHLKAALHQSNEISDIEVNHAGFGAR